MALVDFVFLYSMARKSKLLLDQSLLFNLVEAWQRLQLVRETARMIASSAAARRKMNADLVGCSGYRHLHGNCCTPAVHLQWHSWRVRGAGGTLFRVHIRCLDEKVPSKLLSRLLRVAGVAQSSTLRLGQVGFCRKSLRSAGARLVRIVSFELAVSAVKRSRWCFWLLCRILQRWHAPIWLLQ